MPKKYRKGKNRDFAPLDIMVGYSKNYADNWDRVFGKKERKKKEDGKSSS